MQNAQPPFRLNSRVAALGILTLLALALPIGLIVYGLRDGTGTPAAVEEEPVAPPALREALETVAEETLPPANLTSEVSLEARVLSPNPGQLVETITGIVSEAGGVMLRGEEESKLTISLPADRAAEGLRRLELVSGTELPPAPSDGSSVLLMLTIVPQENP